VSVLAAQGLCKLFALRLQAVPAGRVQHTCVDEKGLEVSLCCLFEDLLVQREVSHGSLQPGVLLLELLEPSHLIDVETAVLLAPGVVGVLTDVDVPNCLCNAAAFGDGNFNLSKLVQDLLRTVTFSWHFCLPS